MRRCLLAGLFLLGLCGVANAASCFWVGGTGNYSDTTHWASGTGGSASTCAATGGYPHNSADSATLDGASGGGTVTLDVDVNIGVGGLTWGAFTGTIDNSSANHNFTMGLFSGTGAGTRTFKCGSGTFTINASTGTPLSMGTVTGLTFTCGSGNFVVVAGSSAVTLAAGGLTYGSLALGSAVGTYTISGANTFTTFSVTAPISVYFTSVTTNTITNAMTWTGASVNAILIAATSLGTAATLSLGAASTATWTGFRDITVSGAGSMTATSALNLGNNTNISITPPATGGGGSFVGLIE